MPYFEWHWVSSSVMLEGTTRVCSIEAEALEMVQVTQEKWKELRLFSLEKKRLRKWLWLFLSRRTEVWNKETIFSIFPQERKNFYPFGTGNNCPLWQSDLKKEKKNCRLTLQKMNLHKAKLAQISQIPWNLVMPI